MHGSHMKAPHDDKTKPRPKIFCIGFHKTGTTSLATALTILGYRVAGAVGVRDPDIAHSALTIARRIVPSYDAFQDNPWPIIFRDVDKLFPNSKFILTVREPSSWIDSVVRHFGNKETPMRKWIYGEGSPSGSEDIYLERYARHNADVKDYFAQRPSDLLIMNLLLGDKWEKLCPFLGREVPSRPFPHANKGRTEGQS